MDIERLLEIVFNGFRVDRYPVRFFFFLFPRRVQKYRLVRTMRRRPNTENMRSSILGFDIL